MDTIFAPATARGKSGLAVVRISGPQAFAAAMGLAGTLPPPRQSAVRRLRHDGAFVAAAPREARHRPAAVARQIAERALREAFRHGLLATDLLKALEEIAPRPR